MLCFLNLNNLVEGFLGFGLTWRSMVRGWPWWNWWKFLPSVYETLVILSVVLLRVFMQMPTISIWCLVRL